MKDSKKQGVSPSNPKGRVQAGFNTGTQVHNSEAGYTKKQRKRNKVSTHDPDPKE
jgi:hypothetical protein